MVRTKGTDSDQDGIVAGFYVMDSPLLIDKYIRGVRSCFYFSYLTIRLKIDSCLSTRFSSVIEGCIYDTHSLFEPWPEYPAVLGVSVNIPDHLCGNTATWLTRFPALTLAGRCLTDTRFILFLSISRTFLALTGPVPLFHGSTAIERSDYSRSSALSFLSQR